MTWRLLFILIVGFGFSLFTAVIGYHLWQQRKKPGAISLLGLIISAVCLAFPHLLSMTSETLESALLWHYLSLPGLKTTPVFWLFFASYLFNRTGWITRRRILAILVIPVITTLLAWTNSWHGWYYLRADLQEQPFFTRLVFQENFAFWVGLIYSLGLIAIGNVILLFASMNRLRLYRAQSFWLITGALLPMFPYSIKTLGISAFDLTPFAFMTTGVIWSFAVFRYSIFDALPITPGRLVAQLPLGILVIDAKGRMIEINHEACRLLIINESDFLGKTLDNLAQIPQYQKLARMIQTGKPGEFSLVYPGGIRWLQVDHPALSGMDSHHLGHLIVLQDVSTRKRAETMQNMFQQISEKASTTHNLQEFYQSVHQIINQQIPAKNFFIALYDVQTDLISFPYFVDEKDEAPVSRKPRNGLTEFILRTGESVLISPEVISQLRAEESIASIGTPAIDWMGVPLKDDRGATFGVLAVQTYSPGLRYTQQDVDALSFVSRQMGMAIQRITALERVRQSEERFRTLVESQGEGLGIVDDKEYFTFANPAAHAIFGVLPETLVGRNLRDFLDQQEFERVRQQTSLRQRGESSSYEIVIIQQNQERRNVLVTATPQFSPAGEFLGTFGVFRDITDRKKGEAHLAYLGTHDTLTGVFNRNYFESRLSSMSYPTDYPLSILIFDLDGLKTINDSLGHAIGDAQLKALASILKDTFRQEDMISRIGGDEFAVILRRTAEPNARSIFNRFLDHVAEYNQSHPGLPLRVSAGFAHSDQAIHYEDLFKEADGQMYIDKRKRKSMREDLQFP